MEPFHRFDQKIDKPGSPHRWVMTSVQQIEQAGSVWANSLKIA